MKKLCQTGLEQLKAIKLSLNDGKIDKNEVLLADEMYLQKCFQYHNCKIIGNDENNNLFKGNYDFHDNRIKKSIPFVLKAIPEIKIEGKWLSVYVEESIQALHQTGFTASAVVMDYYTPMSLHTVIFSENLD